jgi:hypothetical protein
MLALIEIARWTVAAAFALILILASATDIKYRRIPNWTVVAIVSPALCAPYNHTRAAPPEIRGTRPVALHEMQHGEVVQRCGDIGVVGAQRLLEDS